MGDITKVMSALEEQGIPVKTNEEASFLSESPIQVLGGIRDAAENLLQIAVDLNPLSPHKWMEDVEKPERFLPEVEGPDTVGGGIVRAGSQFLAGFIPVARAAKLSQIASSGKRLLATEAAAIGTEQAVFDPQDPRLSNFIQNTKYKNALTKFLSADESDSKAEARLKMALESAGLGAVANGAISFFRKLKSPAKPQADPIPDGIPRVTKKASISPDEFDKLSKKDPINVNLSKIEAGEDVKDVIAKTADLYKPDIQDARRGVITVKQTAKLADEMGMTVEDLLRRRKGEAFNAEQVLAARNILNASARSLKQWAVKAKTTESVEDLVSFNRALDLHANIQAQVSGITAEAGRALRIFREKSQAAADIKDILDSIGGRSLSLKKARIIDDIAAHGMGELSRVSKRLADPKMSDKLMEVWINGLLSSPTTHAVNAMSNTLTAIMTIPEQLTAAVLGAGRKSDKVYFGEATAKAFGFVQGARDGLHGAFKAFIKEEPSDLLSKIEAPRHKSIGGVTGRVVRLPGSMLQSSDEFFKAIGYRQELNALALRDGLDKGLRGDALKRHIAKIIARPSDEFFVKAIDQARNQTFTKPLGDTGRSFMAIVNNHPTLRLIFPFIRTPVNIVKYAAERTPFGLAMKSVKKELAAGGARRDIAISKMMVGSSLAALSVSLTLDGSITGGGPKDTRERAMLRNTGWQPYSFKIGDSYYSYSRLEPIGILLGVSADLAEVSEKAGTIEMEQLAGMLLASFSKNITNKTFLRGLSELVNALNDPDRYGDRFLQNYAASIIPTGIAHIARTQDPVLRQARDSLDAIKSRIPGISQTLAPRMNVWGEPITLTGAAGPDIISPIYYSKDRGDKVSERILELGVSVSMPTRTIDIAGESIELDNWQYNRYVEMAGKPAKKFLGELIESGFLDAMSKDMQADTIKDIISKFRRAARDKMKAELLDKVNK